MMERRAFISAVGAFLGVTTFAVEAQPGGPRRIGFLSNGNATATSPQREAFRRGLQKLGWIEGQTVTIEYRWAGGEPERLPALVAEFVQVKVDVIVLSGTAALRAAQRASGTIPVVFAVLTDPVALGFVQSLARPGGNMTGLASQFEELITKQLQLLKEAVPHLSRVALLHRPEIAPAILTAVVAAAQGIGLTARTINVAGVAEFENALKVARSEGAGAIHVLPSPYFETQRAQLVELAARYRLPAFYETSNFVQAGGLMSYGPSINEMFGGMAGYVDRILKGANPGDLAIERPSRFELVINLKTAKALGLTIPQSLLLRADDVIQ